MKGLRREKVLLYSKGKPIATSFQIKVDHEQTVSEGTIFFTWSMTPHHTIYTLVGTNGPLLAYPNLNKHENTQKHVK